MSSIHAKAMCRDSNFSLNLGDTLGTKSELMHEWLGFPKSTIHTPHSCYNPIVMLATTNLTYSTRLPKRSLEPFCKDTNMPALPHPPVIPSPHSNLQARGLALDAADDNVGGVLGDDFIVMEHLEFWISVSKMELYM